jgi:beta-lactam-binding protein with PASTA domain
VRTVEVPDFQGMHRQQAADLAGSLGLYILISGNDSIDPKVTVTAQSVPPGTSVSVGTTIKLEFADTKVSD